MVGAGRTLSGESGNGQRPSSHGLPTGEVTEVVRPVASAEDTVTDALRSAILGGLLAPGQRLRQEDLAAQLGVSRIPLRDAFRRLAAEGLVRIDGRRGARVAALSASDVSEIYELRMMLEVHCIRLAIRGLSDEAVARLLEKSEHMDAVATDDAAGRLSRRAFYAELYRHSGRPRMRRLILQLRDDVHRYHVMKNTGASREAHAQLRDLILRRDAEGAARLMRTHLRMAREDLVQVLLEEEGAAAAAPARRSAQRTRSPASTATER